MLTQLLHTLTWLCSTVHGGTVVTFAVLFALYPRLAERPATDVTRVFSAAGPVLGLTMGGWVLGLIGHRLASTGEVSWAWSTPADRLDLATWGVFVVLWASSFVLEIWTLHPVRPDQPEDGPRWNDGYGRLTVHLGVNASLFLGWLVLRSFG